MPILIVNIAGAAPAARYIFEGAGMGTETVNDLETAAVRLAGGDYHVAVLLADEGDSIDACETLRGTGGTPLIVISPGMSTEACVRTIEAGADFCLRRAFGPLELTARVKALEHRFVRTAVAAA